MTSKNKKKEQPPRKVSKTEYKLPKAYASKKWFG